MKHLAKPNTVLPGDKDAPADLLPSASDISVQRLIDDSLLALSREVRNLLTLSSRGKLEASDARDLRDSVKLLFELKDREHESLRKLTDEELKVKAKQVLDDNKQVSDIS